MTLANQLQLLLSDRSGPRAQSTQLDDGHYNAILGCAGYVDRVRSHLQSLSIEGRNVELIALCARNMLEISIIIEYYCVAFPQEAKRYCSERQSDAYEAVEGLSALPFGAASDYGSEHFDALKARIETASKRSGWGSIDQAYSRTSLLAKKLGRTDIYAPFFKVLSKFSHPTALSVTTSNSPVHEMDDLAKCFHQVALSFESTATQLLVDAAKKCLGEGG